MSGGDPVGLDEVLMTVVVELLYFLEHTTADKLDPHLAEQMTREVAFQLSRVPPESLAPFVGFIRHQAQVSALAGGGLLQQLRQNGVQQHQRADIVDLLVAQRHVEIELGRPPRRVGAGALQHEVDPAVALDRDPPGHGITSSKAPGAASMAPPGGHAGCPM